jgi:hypothetical protein
MVVYYPAGYDLGVEEIGSFRTLESLPETSRLIFPEMLLPRVLRDNSFQFMGRVRRIFPSPKDLSISYREERVLDITYRGKRILVVWTLRFAEDPGPFEQADSVWVPYGRDRAVKATVFALAAWARGSFSYRRMPYSFVGEAVEAIPSEALAAYDDACISRFSISLPRPFGIFLELGSGQLLPFSSLPIALASGARFIESSTHWGRIPFEISSLCSRSLFFRILPDGLPVQEVLDLLKEFFPGWDGNKAVYFLPEKRTGMPFERFRSFSLYRSSDGWKVYLYQSWHKGYGPRYEISLPSEISWETAQAYQALDQAISLLNS